MPVLFLRKKVPLHPRNIVMNYVLVQSLSYVCCPASKLLAQIRGTTQFMTTRLHMLLTHGIQTCVKLVGFPDFLEFF